MEINKIYNGDCLELIKELPDESINVILTDPPYLYLKNQKLDRPFDEQTFFNEAKRVLKKDGFIVLFGRGTSFYRWNTILAGLGFVFKEEIIWSKSYCTSPLMNLSRVHETVSIHTKRKGVINKVKVPYLEMKGHNIDGIITDINRLKTALKNTKSLNAVLEFLENNKRDTSDSWICDYDSAVMSGSITKEDRSVSVMRSIKHSMNEQSIIRTYTGKPFKKSTACSQSAREGDGSVNVIQSINNGMNEKSIINEPRDQYDTIHPTQKPVRLLERLLALVSKPVDIVLDPFGGSGSTAIACHNTDRKFICYEIDEEYYNLSVKRVNAETAQKRLVFEG